MTADRYTTDPRSGPGAPEGLGPGGRVHAGARFCAAVLAGVLLGGCARAESDPLPQPPPFSPTAAAAPTRASAASAPASKVSASPSAAALPAPSRGGVEGEIERAVLGYFTALNDAFVTGDTTRYATTFTAGCAACTTLKARLDADRNKGLRADGLRDEVSGLTVMVGTNNTGFASAKVRVPPFRLLDRAGNTVKASPETSSTLTIAVNKTAAGWKVIDVRNAAS